jgi:hypothetical protein
MSGAQEDRKLKRRTSGDLVTADHRGNRRGDAESPEDRGWNGKSSDDVES